MSSMAALMSAVALSLLSNSFMARVFVFLFTMMDKKVERKIKIWMNVVMVVHACFTGSYSGR